MNSSLVIPSRLSYTKSTATFLCDRVSFLFVISKGTGSGLGTSVLNLLADEYTDVYRFTTAVYPSADDDVITSPYNRYLLPLTNIKLIILTGCWANNFISFAV